MQQAKGNMAAVMAGRSNVPFSNDGIERQINEIKPVTAQAQVKATEQSMQLEQAEQQGRKSCLGPLQGSIKQEHQRCGQPKQSRRRQ
ncbi:MAG: hypothetical protein R3C68_05120 [Myxococcota bacterium]